MQLLLRNTKHIIAGIESYFSCRISARNDCTLSKHALIMSIKLQLCSKFSDKTLKQKACMDIKHPFISAYDVVDVKCMMKTSYRVVV